MVSRMTSSSSTSTITSPERSCEGAGAGSGGGSGWAGREMATSVPRPGSLLSSRVPWWAWTRLWTMARPRPVPRPTGLVVKKGSVALASTSPHMPSPSSLMRSCTSLPGPLRVPRSRRPPSGMASRAFRQRFRRMVPRVLELPSTRGWAGSRSSSTSTRGSQEARTTAAASSTWRLRSTADLAPTSLRENTRRPWVMARPRPQAAAMIRCGDEASSRPSAMDSVTARIAARTLFSSWATPPASRPMLSMRWRCWSWVSISRYSRSAWRWAEMSVSRTRSSHPPSWPVARAPSMRTHRGPAPARSMRNSQGQASPPASFCRHR